MLAEAEPKPRRRRNESPCGAPVARLRAWVGPFSRRSNLEKRSYRKRKHPTDYSHDAKRDSCKPIAALVDKTCSLPPQDGSVVVAA